MCLYLNDNAKSRTTKLKARNRKGPIKAYKILERYDGKLYSPYFGNTEWESGKIKTSSRKRLKYPAEVTRTKTSQRQIHKGLHFYMRQADAKSATWHSCYGEVWLVEIKPKDVVSVGQFSGHDNIVAHKAKLIKKVCR